MKVDILILTALKMEHEAIASRLKATSSSSYNWQNCTQRTYQVFVFDHDGRTVTAALQTKTGMGQVDAAIATKDALRDLHPSVVILSGIAGCVGSRDAYSLGDVAIALGVHDYEMSKEQAGTEQRRWRRYDCKAPLLSEIETGVPTDWAVQLMAARPDQRNVSSKYHVGDVLSGNIVMADPEKTNERVLQAGNKVIAVEMESAGVMAALRTEDPEPVFLMIKAFSDYAGTDKSDNSSSKDKWHQYAADSAALLTHAIITHVLTPSYFERLNLPRPEDTLLSELRNAVKCYLKSNHRLPDFATKMAIAAVDEVAKEVASIGALSGTQATPFHVNDFYECSLSRGIRFLDRATAPFHASAKTWAISVDVVSTFWQDPHSSPYLKRYLKDQEHTSTHRLFVYSRPEDLHARCELLDWHSKTMDGTFVTSLENYRAMLSRLLSHDSAIRQKSDSCDFALIQITETDPNGSAVPRRFVAELTDKHLRLHRASYLNASESGEAENYINLFSAIEQDVSTLAQGDISPEFGILRWKSCIWHDKRAWARRLHDLFQDRQTDAFHIAGFSPQNQEQHDALRKILSRLKYGGLKPKRSTASYMEEMGIDVVRLVKRLDYDGDSPRDGISGVALDYGSKENRPTACILMKFSDRSHLRRFMEDSVHSSLRYELIWELGKCVPALADLFKTEGVSDPGELLARMKRDRLFAENVLQSAPVWRLDFLEDEMIDEIVESVPERYLIE